MDDETRVRQAVLEAESLLEKAMKPLREAFIHTGDAHAASKIMQAQDEIKQAYVALRTCELGKVVEVRPADGPRGYDYTITYEYGWLNVTAEDLTMYLKRWE